MNGRNQGIIDLLHVDKMATGSSSDTRVSSPLSFRSSDSEASSSSIASLLDRLKSPMPADISVTSIVICVKIVLMFIF